MKIRFLSTTLAWAVVACVPLVGAENTFHLQSVPLTDRGQADGTLPGLDIVSVTIASSSSVTVTPCISETQRCPDHTPGHISIPFPAAELPAGVGVYITWTFQDLSYAGPIQMTVGFVQNGSVIWETSDSHSKPSVTPSTAYLANFVTTIPDQAVAGPAMVLVAISYGGTTTRAAQQFTVSASTSPAEPEALMPGVQMLSVTVGDLATLKAESCLGGMSECTDPTQGYASMPFPSAALPIADGAYITWMFQSLSYTGMMDMTVTFFQNGVTVGQPSHINGDRIEPGVPYLWTDGLGIPFQAIAGPVTVVVSLSYGGKTTIASQQIFLR